MSRRRFNLIELVIVVTVLLSIGSLFLPTIIKVTAHGQIAACQDNLRQLHKGLNLYSRTYEGLPPWEDGWVNAVAAMDGLTVDQRVAPAGAFACPSQNLVSHDSSQEAEAFWRGSTYGINQHISSKLTNEWQGKYDQFYQMQYQGLLDPSATVLLADAAGGNFFHDFAYDTTVSGFSMTGATFADALGTQPALGLPYARHIGDQALFLFVNGAVETRQSWPNYMGGKGTGGYDFWHGEHKKLEPSTRKEE
ncbi:MAG TPA: hypothetical protein DCR55_08435 [Lentisphaeria bacterium]|mgnify:CR=1 FL=1|nr:hypothetical protein [Lentisphaeria bacterium]